MRAITLKHNEIAALRAKLGLTAKECADYLGFKFFNDMYNYEADPAQVKSAKPMSATHCNLLMMIAEYHHKFKCLPPLDYLKAVNTDQKARFVWLEVPEERAADIAQGVIRTRPSSDPDDLPSAREIRAWQRRDAARKKINFFMSFAALKRTGF